MVVVTELYLWATVQNIYYIDIHKNIYRHVPIVTRNVEKAGCVAETKSCLRMRATIRYLGVGVEFFPCPLYFFHKGDVKLYFVVVVVVVVVVVFLFFSK